MPKIGIEFKNGDNHDNFVTVRDRNLAGLPIVPNWNNKRLNGGDSDVCQLEADGQDATNCRWTATRTDDDTETRTDDATAFAGNIVFVSSR